MRVYVKTFLRKGWGVDDLLLIVSQVSHYVWKQLSMSFHVADLQLFFSTYCTCGLLGVHYGIGGHIAANPQEDTVQAMLFWWLCELFYTITTMLIRLSIAVFLLRIIAKPLYKWIVYGTIGMVLGFSTFYLFLLIFQCYPINFFWGQHTGGEGWCINPAAVPGASIAHSAVSFTADWILAILPIALVRHLQLSIWIKASVAGVLSLGLL
jgi:hypothetical protein